MRSEHFQKHPSHITSTRAHFLPRGTPSPSREERHREILSLTKTFITQHAVSEEQREALLKALEHLVDPHEVKSNLFPFMDLPPLVYAALHGNEKPVYPLTVATTLLYLGIDLLDDLADGDLGSHWRGHPHGEIQLIATTLLSSLPQMALGKLNISAHGRDQLQRTLAEGLLRMSAGQQMDLSHTGLKEITTANVEASVIAKSGEELALFASLAAQFHGAAPQLVAHYAAMGRHLGTAGQMASDCHDLFNAPKSRDVAHGTRTLPIALYLEKKSGPEREHFLDLLDKAQKEPSLLKPIRKILHEAGILRVCGFMIETYCQKAHQELEHAKPFDLAVHELRAVIDGVSLFSKVNTKEGGTL